MTTVLSANFPQISANQTEFKLNYQTLPKTMYGKQNGTRRCQQWNKPGAIR